MKQKHVYNYNLIMLLIKRPGTNFNCLSFAHQKSFMRTFLWVPPFWCNSIRVLEIFFCVSVIPTDTQGCKLVSPNVITFDVNIELQTNDILWYVCKIKQKRQEKFKFITLNLITVEIQTWIRDFSKLIITD